jgi:hypothetical protein
LKRILRTWTSAWLVMALLVSLLPPMAAFAAANVEISNLYTDTNAQGLPTDSTKVTKLTSNPFTLEAYISNISPSEVQLLAYKIINMNTGEETIDVNKKAQLLNDNQIAFQDITFKEGLNKVVIQLGSTTAATTFSPGWVYYAPTTSISELTIADKPWNENEIYPAVVNPNNTGFVIKGLVPNATEVWAYLANNPIGKNGFVGQDSRFIFAADLDPKISCQSTSEICLQPGDNKIKFVAKNDTNAYQTEKQLIYDAGKPFAYQVLMKDTDSTVGVPAEQQGNRNLIDIPVFKKTGSGMNLSLSTKLKNDFATGTTAALYNTVEVSLNGVTIATFDANAGAIASAPITSVTGATYSVSAPVNSTAYSTINFTVNGLTTIPSPASGTQELLFTFKANPTTGLNPVTTRKQFKYYDDTAPYVDKITKVVGQDTATGADIEVQVGSSAEINELPTILKIYGNAQTAGVSLQVDGQTFTGTQIGSSNVFTVTLQGLTDGNKPMTVTPVDASSNPGVVSTYTLNIISTPYVMLNGLGNNARFNKIEDITCGGTAGCFSGRLVNFLPSAANKVEVYVNDKYGVLTTGTITPGSKEIGTLNANGNFTVNMQDIANLYKKADGTNVTLKDLMSNGRNKIEFRIYLNNSAQPSTILTYNIFIVSTDVPDFVRLEPVYNVGTTTRKYSSTTPGIYTTTERVISLQGIYYNNKATGGHSQITMTVHTKDDKNNPIVQYHKTSTDTTVAEENATVTYLTTDNTDRKYFRARPSDAIGLDTNNPMKENNFVFNTYDIKLPVEGEVTIEFTVINAANVTVSRTITVKRVPVSYEIKEPVNVIKNEKGEDQISINGNFIDIIIEAENADSIVFGKEAAEKISETRYKYTALGLKPGKNDVKFVVNRQAQKTNGNLVVINTDTPLTYAKYLVPMNSRLEAFDKELQLTFPKDTMLMRAQPNRFGDSLLTNNRSILFGIGNNVDGRITPSLAQDEYAKSFLSRIPDGAYKPISKLYYIDGGIMLDTNEVTPAYLKKNLYGRGEDPFPSPSNPEYNDLAFFSRNYQNLVVPSQRGTLTLQFDRSIRDDAWKYVTVMFFDTYEDYGGLPGRNWKNIGGVVDTKKNTITVPFDKFGYYQVMYMYKSYNDLQDKNLYERNEIETLYSKNIMKSKSTAQFSPYEFISRGEFTQMLVKIFDIPLNYSGTPTFSDVPNVDYGGALYEYKYIETAARAGIVRGLTNNVFGANNSITREQAAVMIARVADLKMNSDTKKAQDALAKTFTDWADIDYYAAPAVEAMLKAKFIEGRENVPLPGQKKATVRFDPRDNLKRSEAAVIGMRIMKSQKKVPN